MDFKNIDYGQQDTYINTFTSKVISQVVAEQDEYTMKIIEDYVNKQRANGECINMQIIPEGKLRHVINLGIAVYAENRRLELNPQGMFSELAYVEYLRKENDNLRKLLSEVRKDNEE